MIKYYTTLMAFFFYFLLHFSLFSQNFQQAKPWMGIAIENAQDGVKVKGTMAGTPAEKAGFVSGDVIKKIDGNTMKDAKELTLYIQSKGVGNEVKIDFERSAKNLSIKLKLEARPDDLEVLRRNLVGVKVPSFNLERISDNGNISNKEIENSITVIEFWATWCPACVSTLPKLSRFTEENKSIKVLAISNEDKDDILSYAKKHKYTFSIFLDKSKEFIKFFTVSAIPMTVVIDKNGVIQHISLGAGAYFEESLNFALDLNKKSN
jgi:thiol-disulfide isomerase/thioredoxin